jgi:hypothetical protein
MGTSREHVKNKGKLKKNPPPPSSPPTPKLKRKKFECMLSLLIG